MEPTAVRRPPGLSDLNFDTLLPIISLLTTRDVAHLTRTCCTLRRALSAELLREGVNLEGRHLTSFLAFTDVKHGKDRVSYLEGLRLLGSTYKTISSGDQVMSSKDVKRTLSTILLAASNLKYLFIRDLNMFHFRPRELKTLLDSLPCLQLLEMQGVQNKYEGVLVDVIPRLRSLGLDVLEDCDLNVFLKARECSNLHDMMLYGRTFNLQDVSLSFPSVRTLYASPANLPSDIDALTRIFPNITHLTLLFPLNYTRLDFEFRKALPEYLQGGVSSLAWYNAYTWTDWRARLLARPERKPDAWPHLQSLRAMGTGMERMGWLGLACQVPRFELCDWRPDMKHGELKSILRELRPRCLVVHPGMVHWRWESGMNRLYGWTMLFALRSTPFVTRLTVIICKEEMSFVSGNARWLDALCTCLEKSCVMVLLFRLHFYQPLSDGLSAELMTWRAAMSERIPSLETFLFQIEDSVHLGWTRQPEGWAEMKEQEVCKVIESEKISPVSIQQCGSCPRNE